MQIVLSLIIFLQLFNLYAGEEEIIQAITHQTLEFQMSRCVKENGTWTEGVLSLTNEQTNEQEEVDCSALLQLTLQNDSDVPSTLNREEYFKCVTQDWDMEKSIPLAKELVLELNKVYNCPGKDETYLSCAEDIGCNIVNSLANQNLAGKAYNFLTNKSISVCESSTDSGCISEIMYGVFQNLTTQVTGIWDGIKLMCLWCDTEQVEDATSESMHAASSQEDGFFDRLMEDPYDATVGAVGRLLSTIGSYIGDSIENNFGCAKWAESRYTSILGNEPKCLEPIYSMECATCSQKLNMACGVVGFMGGEVIMAVLTGATVNVASKIGKAVDLSGVAAKVAEKASYANQKFQSIGGDKIIDGLGKMTGAIQIAGNAAWGIVSSAGKLAIRMGDKLVPLSDETLAMLKSAGSKTFDIATYPVSKYSELLEKAFVLGMSGEDGLKLYTATKLSEQTSSSAEVIKSMNYSASQEKAALKLQSNIDQLEKQYMTTVERLMKKSPLTESDKAQLSKIQENLEKAKVAASDLKAKFIKAKGESPVTEEVASNAKLSDQARKEKAAQKLKESQPQMSNEEIDRASQSVVDAHNDFPCEVGKCTDAELKNKIATMKEAGVPKSEYREFLRTGMAGNSPDLPVTTSEVLSRNVRRMPDSVNPYEPGINAPTKAFREDLANGVFKDDNLYVSYINPQTGERLPVKLDPTDLNTIGGETILTGHARTPDGTYYPVTLKDESLASVRVSSTARQSFNNIEENIPALLGNRLEEGSAASIVSRSGNGYENARVISVDSTNNIAEVRIPTSNGGYKTQVVETSMLREPTHLSSNSNLNLPIYNDTTAVTASRSTSQTGSTAQYDFNSLPPEQQKEWKRYIEASKPAESAPVKPKQEIAAQTKPIVEQTNNVPAQTKQEASITAPERTTAVETQPEIKTPDTPSITLGLKTATTPTPAVQVAKPATNYDVSNLTPEQQRIMRSYAEASKPQPVTKKVELTNEQEELVEAYVQSKQELNNAKDRLKKSNNNVFANLDAKEKHQSSLNGAKKAVDAIEDEATRKAVRDEIASRLQETRSTINSQRASSKSLVEQLDALTPSDLKGSFDHLSTTQKEQLAIRLKSMSDSEKDALFNLARDQKRSSEATAAQVAKEQEIARANDPNLIGADIYKLKKQKEELANRLSRRTGSADVVTNPGQEGYRRLSSGEVVEVNTTNSEYRAMSGRVETAGTDYKMRFSKLGFESSLKDSGLSSQQIYNMYDSFSVSPTRLGYNSRQSMEKAYEYISKIPPGARSEELKYIYQLSKDYMDFYDISLEINKKSEKLRSLRNP